MRLKVYVFTCPLPGCGIVHHTLKPSPQTRWCSGRFDMHTGRYAHERVEWIPSEQDYVPEVVLTDDERADLELAVGVGYRELANGDPGAVLPAAAKMGLSPTDWSGPIAWDPEES